MSRTAFSFLTFLILLGILLALFAQAVILPGAAAEEVASFPAYEPYRTSLVAAGIAFLVCAQVSLVALWMLLLRAHQDVFFRPGSQLWVAVIAGAVGLATLLVLGLFVFLTFFGLPTPGDGMEDLGLWMASGLGCLIGGAMLGVVFVGRLLLKRAIHAHTELDGVV
jgi:hypothetical protein